MENKKYICKICNKTFDNPYKLGAHITNVHRPNRCRKISQTKTLLRIEIIKYCKKCGNEFKVERTINKNGTQNIRKNEKKFCSKKCANSHIQTEKQNKIRYKKLKGLLSSNWKGGISQKIKCKTCKKEISPYGKLGYCKNCLIKSDEYRQAISKGSKGKSGGYRKGGGRSKGDYYNDVYFDSPFEIEIAKFLNQNKIKWIRNTKRFYFNWEDKKTYYIPDFYLPEYKLYLETKGYWYLDKKEKTNYAVKINNLNWILLMQKEWIINNNILLEKIKINKTPCG